MRECINAERVFHAQIQRRISNCVQRENLYWRHQKTEESCSNDNSSSSAIWNAYSNFYTIIYINTFLLTLTLTRIQNKNSFWRGLRKRDRVYMSLYGERWMCVFVSVYDRLKRSIWRSTHSFLIYVHSICMGFKQNQKIYIFTPTNAFNWILNSAGVRETRRSSNATWLEFNAIATLQLRYVRESEQSTLHTLHKSVIRNIPKYGNRIGERTFGVRMCAELLNIVQCHFQSS